MRHQDQVPDFIRASFPSIWSLEIMLHLKKSPRVAFSREELITRLRASDAVVSNSIASLLAGGFVCEEADKRFRYCPASSRTHEMAAATEALYQERPHAVRRVIVEGSANLSAFADAFKLWSD
jgi:hypothetical protein